MRTRYKIIDNECIYFITSTIVEWIPVFTTQKYSDIIIQSLKYCKEHKGLELYAYVILDNYFHLVASAPELSSVVASLKQFTAREIIAQLEQNNKGWLLNQLKFYKKRNKTKSNYQVWQEGFHPELILNEEMLIQKIEYIHYNPAKRGFVDMPEHWRYSSCHDHSLNDQAMIEIDELAV